MPARRSRSAAARLAAWAVILAVVVALVACGKGSSNGGRPSAPDTAAAGSPADAASTKSWAGKDPAPAFPSGLQWFNVQRPLTLADLRGKVVVLDFWTLGCINCQHVFPDLKRLETEFGDALAVVGVHSGKYATEHDDASVRDAIKRFALDHPVVNDPDFATWNTFGANAWPTLVIIDPAGKLVGKHAGEGVYPLFQPIVKSLIQEFDAKGQVDRKALPIALDTATAATVLSFPAKVLADAPGNRLFIADSGHNRVLVSDLAGRLTAVYGSEKEGFSDGSGTDARFRQPQGLALAPDGKTLFVADTRNHAVRSIALAGGQVTTVAGTGQQLDQLPQPGAKARATALSSPWDLAFVGTKLYVTMAGIHQLWEFDPAAGTIGVYAGTSREGIDDGVRLRSATLAQPSGIVAVGTALYWADPESSSIRSLETADGDKAEVRTLVGTGLFDYGAKDGQGKSAQLQHAQGIATDGSRLFVADTYNHRIRVLDLVSHNVTTLAGGERGWSDGPGPSARFDEPGGASFAAGKLYVADGNNSLVRVVDPASGATTTLQLSNLGVLGDTGGGRTVVDLPPQSAAAGAGTLRVVLSAPAGYHLNSQGPSTLALSAADRSVVGLAQPSLTWSTDDASVSLTVPLDLHAGTTVVTGQASAYYCRSGAEALCFIEQVELRVPVTVSAGAAPGEVSVSYTLPEQKAS